MLFPKGTTLDGDPKQCRNASRTRKSPVMPLRGLVRDSHLDLSSSSSVYTITAFSDILACISAGEQVLPRLDTESISAYICLRDTQSCPAVSSNDTSPMEAAH